MRAIAMALQAILVRAGAALPTTTDIIELEVDGEYLEVVLGPRPTATVRTSMAPAARVATTSAAISAFLMGQPGDGSTFNHVSGDQHATQRLISALGGPE